jgi:hypothetical protein
MHGCACALASAIQPASAARQPAETAPARFHSAVLLTRATGVADKRSLLQIAGAVDRLAVDKRQNTIAWEV